MDKFGEGGARREAECVSWLEAWAEHLHWHSGPRGAARPGPLGLSAGMAFITEGDPFNELSAFGAGL